jgi:predicted transcriptional regulator
VIESLPRREREIFEILVNLGDSTAAQIRERMIDPPSYSAVRTLVGRLEAKGLVSHKTRDQSYVYRTVPQRAKVRDSALKQMVRTFFDGSAANAATALLGLTRSLKPEELEALQRAVDEAKERQQGAAS